MLDAFGALASITAVLVCLTLAFVLFWRKSEDWMVMFISSVVPSCIRDNDGWSLGESGSLLPLVALSSNRCNSALVLDSVNRSAFRSVSRREIRSSLDVLAGPVLDPADSDEPLPTLLLLIGYSRHARARCFLGADLLLPLRFRTNRAATVQMDSIRHPIVVADGNTRRTLQYRDQPSTR